MKKFYVAVFVLLSVLASQAVEAQGRNPTVYVGGSYYDMSVFKDRACYWVNGELHKIDGESVDAITVYKGGVYAAGSVKEYVTYRYWVDGNPYELPGCKRVDRIFVNNWNVYVVGDNQKSETTYWRNGNPYPAPSDGSIWFRGFTVVDDVVYSGGFYNKGDDPYACYWIDGVRHELPNSKGYTVCGIEVIDGHVYIGAVSSGYSGACYWIDGVQHTIPAPKDRLIDGFCVSNGNVYMMSEKNYWVNGVRHNFSETYFMSPSYAVFRGKIYIAGGGGNPGQMGFTPYYWIDGIRYNLKADRGITSANITSIFVAE